MITYGLMLSLITSTSVLIAIPFIEQREQTFQAIEEYCAIYGEKIGYSDKKRVLYIGLDALLKLDDKIVDKENSVADENIGINTLFGLSSNVIIAGKDREKMDHILKVMSIKIQIQEWQDLLQKPRSDSSIKDCKEMILYLRESTKIRITLFDTLDGNNRSAWFREKFLTPPIPDQEDDR